MRSGAPRVRQTGAALVEAAIALPLFFALAGGLLDFANLFRQQLFARRALTAAGRALVGASTVEGLTDKDCVQRAGIVFVEELKRRGVPLASIEAAPGSYVLLHKRFAFPVGSNVWVAPQGVELAAVVRPACLFCRLAGMNLDPIPYSITVVLETGDGCRSTSGAPLAYYAAGTYGRVGGP